MATACRAMAIIGIIKTHLQGLGHLFSRSRHTASTLQVLTCRFAHLFELRCWLQACVLVSVSVCVCVCVCACVCSCDRGHVTLDCVCATWLCMCVQVWPHTHKHEGCGMCVCWVFDTFVGHIRATHGSVIGYVLPSLIMCKLHTSRADCHSATP